MGSVPKKEMHQSLLAQGTPMLHNSYKITADKITFHTSLVARLVLVIIGAAFLAELCWLGTVGSLHRVVSLVQAWDEILLIFLLLPLTALGIFIVSTAFMTWGFLDLQKMSYEGFSYSLFFRRKIAVPRQEMLSVIVLHSDRHNTHSIVIVCSRPISQLAAIDNQDYVNYIFLTPSFVQPEAEYLAQMVADCLNLPYFGIQDRRRG